MQIKSGQISKSTSVTKDYYMVVVASGCTAVPRIVSEDHKMALRGRCQSFEYRPPEIILSLFSK